MDDLISREDAIEAVGEWMQKEYGYLDLNRAERLIDALSALPSAEAEWIPCSERLPKEKEKVLIYDKYGDVDFGRYDKGQWYWEAEAIADYWMKDDGVVAWMPLPEPYREEDEEE